MVMVIRELVLKEVEPEFLALSMGITVANLYNIKSVRWQHWLT